MVPGNPRSLRIGLSLHKKVRWFQRKTLCPLLFVSSETGRLKVKFLEKNLSAFLGCTINGEWSWATKF